MQTTPIIREFHYQGQILPDPDPKLSPAKVQEVYAITYPELATGRLTGPKLQEGRHVFTFERAVGAKG